MAKSVYSLVLNDEIVDLVDKMAKINGVSRSLMIEKILANACSYETFENRADNIFNEIERLITESNSMRYLSQPSKTMASIMSAIDYRYNPQIKYSVELFSNSSHLGQLKVTLRTQNTILVNLISDFYTFYSYLEKTYYNENARFLFDGVKFTRLFNFPEINLSAKAVGELLTDYVKDFDELLSLYFSELNTGDKVFNTVQKRYIQLKNNKIKV